MQPHSAEAITRNFSGDVSKLKKEFDRRPIVASTCLGISHPAVAGRKFDYCIFDEAGQALLLATLGPLFYCDKFVLVGDPQQLPPVVQSSEARKLGLEKSLFAHLEDDDNVIPLTLQYRMNRQIQWVANFLTYAGQLECGTDEVSERALHFNGDDAGRKPGWLQKIADSNIKMSVLFIDTTQLGASERSDESGICNDVEAEIVDRIFDLLQKSSTSHGEAKRPTVGVIAPYRAQVSNLRRTLSKYFDDRFNVGSVNTVDQFQGRDCDVIIYSCTRCRPKAVDQNGPKAADILSDARRLNVAVTRAKVSRTDPVVLALVPSQSSSPNFCEVSRLLT